MRSQICVLFIFAIWLASANLAKAQGNDATVKKTTTKPKKAATVKPPSSSKTNAAKQTPKSNNSSSKSVAKTSNKTKAAAGDETNESTVLGGAPDKPLTLSQILVGLQTQGKTPE